MINFGQPEKEVANIISSPNSNKVFGHNSIPYGILFLLKNEISKKLTEVFNLSFRTGVFPSVLKTTKVDPVFMKNSKLDYSYYCPISLLPIYFGIFDSYLSNWCLVWAQNRSTIQWIVILQKKLLELLISTKEFPY